jgi:flap endonuclease-1
MGVDLGELVPHTVLDLDELPKAKVAIDAYNALYQFLTVIRQPNGTPLMNSKGQITSHLQGLFYRTISLLELGLKPIYVFDGEIPALKKGELVQRSLRRERAAIEAKNAYESGQYDIAYKKSVQATKVNAQIVAQAKELLGYMGIPIIDAPFEGEAQASKLVIDGQAYACASQDYDALLFGSPRLLRNLTITGKRKLPGKDQHVDVKPELIELSKVLQVLGLTRSQLIELAILIGTDYNPRGFPGIGPKTAYKLIKEYSVLKKVLEVKKLEPDFDVDAVIQEFSEPKVTSNYQINWGAVNPEAIVNFLCEEQDFSRERVQSAINRLLVASRQSAQQSLEKWFS